MLTGIFLVEASEGVSYHLFRVRSLKPFPEECEEHGEVYRAGSVVHHVVQVVVANVLESTQLTLVYDPHIYRNGHGVKVNCMDPTFL